METLSVEDVPNGVASPLPQDVTDPITVLEHISRLIETNLGVARRELEAVGSLLSETQRDDSLNRCARFASEPESALYAQKDRRDSAVNGHGDTDGRSLELARVLV